MDSTDPNQSADDQQDEDSHVVRSPFRPLTRAARRALAEYDVLAELDAPDGDAPRNNGVRVRERPSNSLLEQHELRIIEDPDDVWVADSGEHVEVYADAERVTVDGRDVSMSTAEVRERCREQDRFERVTNAE